MRADRHAPAYRAYGAHTDEELAPRADPMSEFLGTQWHTPRGVEPVNPRKGDRWTTDGDSAVLEFNGTTWVQVK